MKVLDRLKRMISGAAIFMLVTPMLFLGATPAYAADTGWQNPSANTNSGWDNPSYAYDSGNFRAVADNNSDVVEYRNFDIPAIATVATINGIEVSLEGYTGGTRQADVSLSWNNGTSYTTTKLSNLPGNNSSAEAVTYLGSSSDNWGRTWSASEFTNSNFRVKLDATSGGGSNLNIDQVRVKIYYTVVYTTPVITINPYNSSPTNQNITVTASTDVGTLNTTTHTFTANGSFDFVATNGDKTTTSTVTITNIDKAAPTASVSYSPSTWTNGNVVATITPSEPVTITNNGGSASRTFTTNSSYTFNFVDTAGNTGSKTATVSNIDKTGPTSNVSSLPDYSNNYLLSIPYSKSDSGSGVAAVALWYKKGSGSWTNYGSFTSSPISFDSNSTGGNGYYEFYVVATDNAGNSETQSYNWWTGYSEESIYVDNVFPIVSTVTVSPDYNPYVDGHDFDIRASVSDGGSGINWWSCEYTKDGGSHWYDADYDFSHNRCYKNNLTANDGQVVNLNFRVSDWAGNRSTGVTITRTADKANPQISGIEMDPDYYNYSSANPDMKILASDSVSDIASCHYRYQAVAGPDTSWTGWALGEIDGEGDCHALPTGLSDNGYFFEFYVTDSVGHSSNTFEKLIVVDGTNPLDPGSPATTSPTKESSQDWSWTEATDNGSGVKGYWFKVEDETPVFTSTPTITTNLTEGIWMVTVQAEDNVGNLSGTTYGSVVVDQTPPVITYPDDITIEGNTIGGANVEFLVTANDNFSGDVPVSCSYNSGDLFPVGETVVNCSTVDEVGNNANASFKVTVTDTKAPVISLNGATPVSITVGGSYTELGAIATDIVDGVFAATASGTVNTTTIGSYTISYNATDAVGNAATTVVRTVNVVAAPAVLTPLAQATGGEEVAGVTTGTNEETTENQNKPEENQVKGSEDESPTWLNTIVFGMARWVWLMLILAAIVGFAYWWLVLGKRRKKDKK